MKNQILALTTLIFLLPLAAQGQQVCRIDVSYKWQSAPERENATQKNASKNSKDSAMASEKQPEPQEVFYSFVESSGVSLEEATAQVSRGSIFEKSKAQRYCQETHENSVGCVATKYKIMESLLNSISFGARKELHQAIAKDCAKQAGLCKGVYTSKPECREVKIADAKAEGDSKAEAAPKDEKGAKKKK